MVSIDAPMLRRMIIAGANYLERKKQIVDELNVFPVPDGDTGTNMSLTVLAAAKEVKNLDSADIYEIAKAAASGSLRGARGNSGVILSQLFRGFSKALQGHKEIDTTILANAFHNGMKTAYKAVMKPKEGTILTVAREGAEKAVQLAVETEDIEELLRNALEYGNIILQKTPDMLPVLKQAGVVDAGGQGLLYFLEGAFAAMNSTDEEVEVIEKVVSSPSTPFSALASIDHENIVFGYCTEFIINIKQVNDDKVNDLRNYLESIGDSIVVVADDDLIKIHVHTDHPGQALEKALTLGSLTNLKIENMREQHTEKVVAQEISEIEKKPVGFIAVAIGDGLSEIFKGLGVDYVIQGGQTMNPSTEDILNAIDQIHAEKIVILPNNKNIILAAEQAQKLSAEKEVFVIHTRSIPQGIAAMIGYEPGRSIKDNLPSMEENVSYVRTGQITYAVRDTSVDGREIKQGDFLGIAEDQIQVVSKTLEQGTLELIDQLIDEDSEIASIYYGQDITEDQAAEVAEYIEKNYPECEIEIHSGGQPLYYYIFSVE